MLSCCCWPMTSIPGNNYNRNFPTSCTEPCLLGHWSHPSICIPEPLFIPSLLMWRLHLNWTWPLHNLLTSLLSLWIWPLLAPLHTCKCTSSNPGVAAMNVIFLRFLDQVGFWLRWTPPHTHSNLTFFYLPIVYFWGLPRDSQWWFRKFSFFNNDVDMIVIF